MSHRIVSVAAGVSLGLALVLRSLARSPVFEGLPESAEPWLIAALPRWPVLLVAVVVGAAVGTFAPRRLAAPFLLTGLSAAIFVPGLFGLAPFLASFSGRFLDFVIAGCVLWAVWRVARFPANWTAGRAGAAAFCVLLLVSVKMHRDVGLSGDEPHYVLMSHSLIRDGDLRVQNNYFQEDYHAFYRGKIGPRLARDTPYSVHGIGLPLVLAPGYAVFGLPGVVVTLVLMGAVLTAGVFRASELVTETSSAAAVAAGSFALTSPALFLSASAYPELPAALVVVLVAVRFLSPAPVTVTKAIGWAFFVGTLPFFHMKFLPLAGVLWATLGYRFLARSERLAVVAGLLLSVCGLAFFSYATTGSVDPTAAYGRQRIFASGIPIGLLGLFFDQEYGLLTYAPVYLAALAGVVALSRRRLLLGLGAVAVLASVALPGAAHPLWSGGNSPPARFLFPALPLLAVALGCLWSWEREWGVARWVPTLLVFSWCVSAFTLFLPGQPLYLNARDGTGRLWEALSSSWDLTSYLPSVVTSEPRSLVVASLGTLFVALCLVLQASKRRMPLPAFPIVLLVAAWVQDLTGVSRPRTFEGRFVTAFMRDVAADDPSHFVALPGFERLDRAAVSSRVSLRLGRQRPDGDPRHWWSLPYSIPAGRFHVEGVRLEGWAPCNGFRCFESDGARFESTVALSRFRVRARRLESAPRLYFDTVEGSRPVALRSQPIAGNRRLHSLDDGAYEDRPGFWVKARTRARFLLEPGGELFLSNGRSENIVILRTSSGEERFELAPHERARIELPIDDEPTVFSIESLEGFRPSELDPASEDHRDLGVLIGAPGF